MKKLLDQDIIPNTWEVNSEIRPGVRKSCSHWKKDKQPFKKMHKTTKNPKQERARPLNYNSLKGNGLLKFPLPKPIMTNGVVPEAL